MKTFKILTIGLALIIFVSCGGGSSSSSSSNNQSASNTSNSSSSGSSSSSSSSSSSGSQSNSSLSSIVNLTGCSPLTTGSNDGDDDADGVLNLFDICPNNPNIVKAVAFDFSDVANIGLKTEMNSLFRIFLLRI